MRHKTATQNEKKVKSSLTLETKREEKLPDFHFASCVVLEGPSLDCQSGLTVGFFVLSFVRSFCRILLFQFGLLVNSCSFLPRKTTVTVEQEKQEDLNVRIVLLFRVLPLQVSRSEKTGTKQCAKQYTKRETPLFFLRA